MYIQIIPDLFQFFCTFLTAGAVIAGNAKGQKIRQQFRNQEFRAQIIDFLKLDNRL